MKKLKLFVSLTILACSIAVFSSEAALQKTCHDCGSPGNCVEGNGLNSGYEYCVVTSSNSCYVMQWC